MLTCVCVHACVCVCVCHVSPFKLGGVQFHDSLVLIHLVHMDLKEIMEVGHGYNLHELVVGL